MKAENTWTIHTYNSEQENALKAFVKALKMKFEPAKKSYNPEFVKKIEKSRKEVKEGKGIKMSVKDIDNLWK